MSGARHQKRRSDAPTTLTDKPGLASRQAAAKLVSAIVDKKVSLDGLLDPDNGNPAFRALSPADRALVRAIVVTSLRHLPIIEAMLADVLEKPLPDGARALHHGLVVAVAQIVFLDVPDRAAVDLAVEQATRDPRNRRFASLVNAVLRRIATDQAALREAAEERRSAAPEWFAAMLEADYGADRAQAIIAAQRHEAPIDLTIKNDPHGWAETLGGTVLPTGSVRLGAFDGSIVDLPGFSEGAWFVQDAAASIPARLFGDLSGKSVADLCAAPGGKTAQLVMAGGAVTAFDRSDNRLRRLEQNLSRLGLTAKTCPGDFMETASPGSFDAVLLDAPCSSTGTVRRHPDIVWTKGPADIEKLAVLQETMLRHAVSLLAPGGVLVFSNCSLARREGEEVVRNVLADTPDLLLDPIGLEECPGLPSSAFAGGALRTTPAMLRDEASPRLGGLDGFFAARLRKRGERAGFEESRL